RESALDAKKVPAMHPSGRIWHAVTFDASHAEVLLFGGRLGFFPSDFDDTWVWDGVNWTERFPATSPPPMGGHALAYSAIRGSRGPWRQGCHGGMVFD